MELISAERREEVIFSKPGQVLKLELRDRYDVDRALFEAWKSGGCEIVEKTKTANRNQCETSRLTISTTGGFG